MKISGWVIKKREHGNIIFLDVRTVEKPWEITQVVIKKNKVDKTSWKKAKILTQESSIIVEGELVRNPKAPTGFEIHAEKVMITHVAESPYPLGKKEHSPEVLMKYRHLVVRGQRYVKTWIIREHVIKYFREFFEKTGWHEVNPPILVATAVEGGATLFPVKYFDDSIVYLSQSAQLYLEVMIFSLGKVWSLTPSFRAEKSRTKKHLAEYWHLEAEAAWHRLEDILKVQEEMISYVIKRLLENDITLGILKEFRKDSFDLLEGIKSPFRRVKYDEAISILQSKGYDIKWGDDIGSDEERALSEEIGEFFFLTHFPSKIKPFYVKLDEHNPEVSLSADLLAPEGYGEITGGSEREYDIDVLVKRIVSEGFDPQNYFWYLDLRRYGSVPHSGFGLGLERFIWWLLKLEHIRDTIPFPRLARVKKFI